MEPVSCLATLGALLVFWAVGRLRRAYRRGRFRTRRERRRNEQRFGRW
jgi:hypothetical protein